MCYTITCGYPELKAGQVQRCEDIDGCTEGYNERKKERACTCSDSDSRGEEDAATSETESGRKMKR